LGTTKKINPRVVRGLEKGWSLPRTTNGDVRLLDAQQERATPLTRTQGSAEPWGNQSVELSWELSVTAVRTPCTVRMQSIEL